VKNINKRYFGYDNGGNDPAYKNNSKQYGCSDKVYEWWA
jgi:hypothetical protein